MIEAAKKIAHHYHTVVAKQVRKYSGLPYTVHTSAVADIVARHGGSPIAIAAAHLHDTIEDTPLALAMLHDELLAHGVEESSAVLIGHYVSDLTDVFTKTDFPACNRRERKDMERNRQAAMSQGAKAIKMADCIDNAKDILINDPGFGKVFVSEVRKLFPLIKDAHAGLAAELEDILWPKITDYSI